MQNIIGLNFAVSMFVFISITFVKSIDLEKCITNNSVVKSRHKKNRSSAFATPSACIPVVGIRYGGPGHLDVVTPQEEQQHVAREAHDVGDEHELHGALGPQLEPLQQAAAHEYADAGARDRDRACPNRILRIHHFLFRI